MDCPARLFSVSVPVPALSAGPGRAGLRMFLDEVVCQAIQMLVFEEKRFGDFSEEIFELLIQLRNNDRVDAVDFQGLTRGECGPALSGVHRPPGA